MELRPVKSSVITHAGHDGKSLHVVYASGKTYVHPNVPAKALDDLMTAPSAGAYLNQHIRNQYPGKIK